MKKLLSKNLWNDTDVEQLVGQLLRYGVITACILALIGGIAYLTEHGSNPVPQYGIFTGEGAEYTTFKGILNGVLTLNPNEIIQFGVLALIATPILRVLFSLFAFILEKDKLYIGITLIVLCILMTSIFGGLKV
ncbi:MULTISPECIES: DUF1634 domain-containing protein [Flavobacterium]|uniref:DUF1634 domain-containing protein n=1 Tax=Flavobacterium TaxID=237 RepID=UPI00086C6694|nr:MULTISPECIES: DUF1634 domain-containing protein [Flavobacterium]MBN9284809.1 DUF1634 domain-containing protein [Flavobacterium sp.]ODS77357.1 MAG: hypothetical protein ABS44_22720 [Chryseobacterium sp. SCN 40-13]OJV71305.1 MAG: hypothetical protein BGO42_07765 [Flavobacterium sp. 40-81]